MDRFNLIALTLAALGLAGFMIPNAGADIYSWTDENGVRYFTNQQPPKHAELLIKSPEIPFDEAAHEERRTGVILGKSAVVHPGIDRAGSLQVQPLSFERPHLLDHL